LLRDLSGLLAVAGLLRCRTTGGKRAELIPVSGVR
jgi:hypothetical protein